MSRDPHDLVIRSLRMGELSLFDAVEDPGLVGFAAFGETFAAMAARGEYRPEWVRVALRDGEVVARAAWWGGPDDEAPVALDWFDFTDTGGGTALLRDAPWRVEYQLKLPPGWRHDEPVRAAADARIDAALAAGMRPLVERHHYCWTTACGLPDLRGRLQLRPEPDDEAFLAALRSVHEGTLDAHARRAIEAEGFDAAARDELEYLRWLPSPRSWWRMAHADDGVRVGFVVPAHHHADPLIAFVGVLPEHRGQGYAHELVAAATHLLVAEGAERIVAGTDVGNVPMARAFARAGYPIDQQKLSLVW